MENTRTPSAYRLAPSGAVFVRAFAKAKKQLLI
jgi:hypothetical protein